MVARARAGADASTLTEKYFLSSATSSATRTFRCSYCGAFGMSGIAFRNRLVLIGRREGLRVDPGVAEEIARLGSGAVTSR